MRSGKGLTVPTSLLRKIAGQTILQQQITDGFFPQWIDGYTGIQVDWTDR